MRRALTWVGWCGERSDRAGAPAAAAQGSTAAQQTGVGPRFQYGLPPPAAVQPPEAPRPPAAAAGAWAAVAGARCEAARFGVRGSERSKEWYPGVILRVDAASGCCDVKYDDGDYEQGVRPQYVRQLRGAAPAAADAAPAPAGPRAAGGCS